MPATATTASTTPPSTPTATVSTLGCCAPLGDGELSTTDAEQAAAVFKALADPVRLRLLSKIAASPDGEACVCDLLDVGVSQPTVSHHLKRLREAGLLTSRREGTWIHYRLVPGALDAAAAVLRPSR